jgi:AcrR family transcriptional regulator
VSASAKRRLGRPPASSSADTRDRLLDVARRCFAELGYESTTNKYLSGRAGITTGAIYHYFESKLDIYAAVHDDVQDRVYRRFEEAVDGVDTFVGQFEAVLETAHQLNTEDPTLAQFLGAARTDKRRHPEIAEALGSFDGRRDRFYRRMVDRGVPTGEITKGDEKMVLALVTTVLIGLTDAVSHDARQHRLAVDALTSMFEGRLVRSPV